MNTKTVIALCLVVAFIASQTGTDAKSCWKVCEPFRCYKVYFQYNGRPYYTLRCYRFCLTVCGKRDEAGSQMALDDSSMENSPASKLPGPPIPLDYKFSDYDKNKDGQITYKEFQNAMPSVDVREGFDLMDKNGDGKINCAEFLLSRRHVDYGKNRPVCK